MKSLVSHTILILILCRKVLAIFCATLDETSTQTQSPCELSTTKDINEQCLFIEQSLKKKLGGYQTGADLIRGNGFPLETHTITSADGYITTLFRIPFGRIQTSINKGPNQKVALLHHGIIEDAFAWSLNSVTKALAYRLADLGNVDVWMTSNRGTHLSLGHTQMSWLSYKYWNFSFHEIAIYDVPVIIDYILRVTQQPNLYYIGHSMGCAAFAVAMSLYPEYNAKIRTFVGLAPAIFVGNTKAPFQPLIPAILKLQEIYDTILLKPFVPPELIPFMQHIGNICSHRVETSWICFAVLESIFGYDFEENNYDLSREIMANGLSSASMKSLFHLLQLWKSGQFQYYDYLGRNVEAYGQFTPPQYDLSNVTSPTVLCCGQEDNLVSCPDVLQLAHTLPNVKEFRVIGWKKFNHIDFLFARDINPLLNDRIVEIIKNDLYYVQ